MTFVLSPILLPISTLNCDLRELDCFVNFGRKNFSGSGRCKPTGKLPLYVSEHSCAAGCGVGGVQIAVVLAEFSAVLASGPSSSVLNVSSFWLEIIVIFGVVDRGWGGSILI